MRDVLCEAFCANLTVSSVPAGLAIGTPFQTADGDQIGFYVIGKAPPYMIADDGSLFPILEASGVDFRSGTRGDALNDLRSEYGVTLDEDTQEFRISGLTDPDVPAAALRFVAFSLRVRDFMLMTEFRVASTFRDDAERLLREVVADRVVIHEAWPLAARLKDFPADFVLAAPNRRPVGVFLGTSTERVLEAIQVHMMAKYETHDDCSVVALLESISKVSARVRQQAMNRLDAVAEFRGDELAAISRIVSEAIDTRQVH